MSDRQNVLLICTDHWPGSLLGVEGHPAIETPTVDELARNGIRFSRAYSECPVCIPARRTIMTGTTPRTHGDRVFHEEWTMPRLPTLASAFRSAGYQTFAAGKLHVYPQRDRIGFDDVLLAEEGRGQWGVVDDYEAYLGDNGHAGRQFAHGMSNNQYVARPWHLPEHLHVTNWTTEQMERIIKRRDPQRPSFWYLSYTHPHPPLVPLPYYHDLYARREIDEPVVGAWAEDPANLPYKTKKSWELGRWTSPASVRAARVAFYALCTHIDHQIRRVIGTLREEGELDRTIIMFTADHGEMLGDHRLWAKRIFYENSTRIPMIVALPDRARAGGTRDARGCVVDDRLVGLQDVMPTLLDLSGIEPPEACDGRSMFEEGRRGYLYGEEGEGATASRMIRTDRFKLIYYPAGNRVQLFDLEEDPRECNDLDGTEAGNRIRSELVPMLVKELHGDDRSWLNREELVGIPEPEYRYQPRAGLFGQRGTHWPPPPRNGRAIDDLQDI